MAKRRTATTGHLVLLAAVMLSVMLVPTPAESARFLESAIELFADQYGRRARARLLEWDQVMSTGVEAPGEEKRRRVNEFFNRIPWLPDQDHWAKQDYWATPLEMLGTNGGDCEDYSIAKFFTLTELRVPGEQLLITYVRAPALNQTRMVLAYYATPDADPLILDNLINEVRRGSERPDLIPVYSFNAKGLWMAVEQGRGRRVGASERIHMWREVTRRMLAENSPGSAELAR